MTTWSNDPAAPAPSFTGPSSPSSAYTPKPVEGAVETLSDGFEDGTLDFWEILESSPLLPGAYAVGARSGSYAGWLETSYITLGPLQYENKIRKAFVVPVGAIVSVSVWARRAPGSPGSPLSRFNVRYDPGDGERSKFLRAGDTMAGYEEFAWEFEALSENVSVSLRAYNTSTGTGMNEQFCVDDVSISYPTSPPWTNPADPVTPWS